jgi:hypothetical protein
LRIDNEPDRVPRRLQPSPRQLERDFGHAATRNAHQVGMRVGPAQPELLLAAGEHVYKTNTRERVQDPVHTRQSQR